MKHTTKLFKVKEEYVEEVLAWFKFLNTELTNGAELLKEEALSEEEAFMFRLEDQWYCLFQMRFEETKLPPDMSHEVNRKHAELMKKAMEPAYASPRNHLVYRLET